MKTIKMIAYKVDGSLYKADKKDLPKIPENTIISNWWYLHGDLQTFIGYDKGIITNYDELPTSTKLCYFNGNEKYFNVMTIEDGVYNVKIKGINKSCIGFFWTTEDAIPRSRGLVCYKDDSIAMKYARSKYIEKSRYL